MEQTANRFIKYRAGINYIKLNSERAITKTQVLKNKSENYNHQ
jgi:hypothetical protein